MKLLLCFILLIILWSFYINWKRNREATKEFLLFTLILAAILGFLFRGSFKKDQVHFSNDGPLGVHMSDWLNVWTDSRNPYNPSSTNFNK